MVLALGRAEASCSLDQKTLAGLNSTANSKALATQVREYTGQVKINSLDAGGGNGGGLSSEAALGQ